MLESLISNTALPSLHPAIIHFPIALIALAWLLRVLQLIRPRVAQFKWGADWLVVLAALGSGAAWLSGREAVNGAGSLSVAAELAITKHADLAGWAVTVLIIAALIPRICSLAMGGANNNSGSVLCGWVNMVAVTVALGIVGATADLGGALVFTHGVGVASEAEGSSASQSSQADQSGGVASERARMNFPAGRTDWQYTAGTAMKLTVDGSGFVALPGQWGDSVVESAIDPENFEGTLTLVHRYLSPTVWEGFEFDTEGTVRLIRSTAEGFDVRAENSLMFFREQFTFRSSSVAEHFKGLVDDDVVAHGHGKSGAEGQVGVMFKGSGDLTILSLEASGAEEH